MEVEDHAKALYKAADSGIAVELKRLLVLGVDPLAYRDGQVITTFLGHFSSLSVPHSHHFLTKRRVSLHVAAMANDDGECVRLLLDAGVPADVTCWVRGFVLIQAPTVYAE